MKSKFTNYLKQYDKDYVETPEVSIIIPVHNKFEYTYRCLLSIYNYTDLSKIEIIIADDDSSDETIYIDKYFKDITIVRNNPALGFVKNCNKASKLAKGKFILFLNNDTQVQPGWLDALLETVKSDEKIGLVGPKLVYPDGRLQEAGGIIWKDGSGWNYGRFDDSEKPEYNYLKEVDYISGACILIRRDLWDKIGGFDERYSPAYYEDTDLAFEIRKRGYKVIYQPKSVVVHFEGITHGTDISSGVKKYQEINRNKFVDKWKEILERDHLSNGAHPFLVRDRSIFKKHILIIDHYVPRFDQDAGSRVMFQWMKIIKDLGLQITFIGDDFYKHEPYTSILQQMGIEVIYGHWYKNNWKNCLDYLKRNLKYFDYILLSRSSVSEKYIKVINVYRKEDSKLIYFPHDLSFLRLEREYEVTGNWESLKGAERLKKVEYKLFKESDIILLVSNMEKQIILRDFPDKNVIVMPLFVYDSKFPISKNDNFEERNGILFVGGFTHRPNYYGVKWFIETIWSKVKKEIPDITFYIVGSNIPEDIISLEKEDENIKVLGYVSDDVLRNLYDKIRVVIAPLTYGAGVKGKVIEAIAHGIPIVTTSIGAEGIELVNDIILIADTPEEFYKKLCEGYTNQDLWKNLRLKMIEYAKKYLSYERGIELFRTVLGE